MSDKVGERKATVSLVAYSPLPADEPDRDRKTLEKMAEHVAQAAGLGSDLVAFPEICNKLGKGWEFEPLDGPTVDAMARAAAENSVYVVCPLATIQDDQRQNSSVLIDRDGGIVGVYNKNVPTHGELSIGIIPGTQTPVFETEFGRIGLSICFNLNYWEVGSRLCANKAELVIWSSMWTGVRMMCRWSIEFGFYMAGVHAGAGSFIDPAGRPISNVRRTTRDIPNAAAMVTADLDLDRRLLHHDGNTGRLAPLYEKYGPAAAYAEHLGEECQLLFGSELPDKSSDELIEEFQLEPMRDYLARVRRDRKRALEGTFPVSA